ncbi:MAG TPA: multifunctional oxoglutarate decarboxylase/oxoglutarate dehydrogenase thiamine pyrophosphate-binding subunit/dihydrolipoyllysine-residue succinyltransferase subunit, partial [Acidimicrobiales bacterium]|nr:multifunctional oxoglutarate decarboxylase/oxoglutarate dehydrogenase thiamine pyrophosphate-binding subunit/dihydrolipoyllysine-residue succinyltransferase subunit [Acidimicrobiales bacterium]
EERERGLSPAEATHVASARTGRAFFASALTTAGGFAVLIFSALPLLSDFGAIVALNVSVALVSALVVLPPLMVWADNRGLLGVGDAADPTRPTTQDTAVAGAMALALAVGAIVMIVDATDSIDDELATPVTVPAGSVATIPPPTTAPPTTAPPDDAGPTTTLPPGPPERPDGLVAGALWDAYTAAGADPGVARCLTDTLIFGAGDIAPTSEQELLALGIANDPPGPEAAARVAAAADACGVPDEVSAAVAGEAPPAEGGGDEAAPATTLPPGPPERPDGLVAGALWDAYTAAGADPGVARCLSDTLILGGGDIEPTTEAEMLALGIANDPPGPEAAARVAAAADACGVPDEVSEAVANGGRSTSHRAPVRTTRGGQGHRYHAGVADPSPSATSMLGPNAWLVDEMYEQYRADPGSVSEAWREFFADYRREPAADRPAEPAPAAAPAPPAPATPPTPNGAEGAAPEAPPGTPIRGAGARIVANMEASLGVPTATSFREVPAKLLEVNRKVINGYLGRTRGGKVSFTHLIGYAVVRAIADAVPAMNSTFHADADGKPYVQRHDHIGLGIAVDMEKSDGSRTLLVPCVTDADALDFREFHAAYEELIRKVRTNKLTPDDFAGTTVSLTNPGTIGTVQSVPRLMPGQGLIVGVGAIDYPTAYQAADPRTLADLGVSKVITLTSTYDHRIIQGAESGLFLKKVHELLLGADNFYDDVFRSLGVPYEAVHWRRDVNPVERETAMLEKQMAVNTLINMYRVRGHLIADLDPLASEEPHMHAELDPASYGLTIWDLDREFLTGSGAGIYAPVGGRTRMVLGDILGVLRDAYCRTIGIEYMHIQEPTEKRWIQEQVEGVSVSIDHDGQRHILGRLNAAEAFERFLSTKYVGQKRFGIEGAESTIPLLDAILGEAADHGFSEAVLGMAHRGRLNVLANIVGKSYDQIFKEFEGNVDPESTQGSGDVKYHLGQSGKFVSRQGNELRVELAANPSHLEAVDPVVVGMVRAKMDLLDDEGRFPVLPLLIHGDAAFAGQGVVAETLNLSMISGYKVGGTIHVIINNQLGFTTPPHAARSSEYPTDIAKMVQAPIFHVNGDDPEACVRVAQLAFQYRQRFNKDVVIDMVCYRRHGHNEGDDPSYTQPQMYAKIDARRSVRKLYTEALVKRGDISMDEAEAALDDFQRRLQVALDETRQAAPPAGTRARRRPAPVGVLPHVDTGVSREVVDRVFAAIDHVPEGFTVHPKLARQFDTRRTMFQGGEVDWALAEAIAFGSLLDEGISIRLAGQDSRRGTFSQRHSTLVDFETGAELVPLAALASGDANLWIYDSLLSEYAALGFEYGYSVANKDALVAWEAQFGDFVNGAQIILDQFLVAAEDKWGQTSGLVMLLPHGYEGQGPEHSSARIERFLILAAEDNIQVTNASTSAQYFHLLRRQMHRDVRKPLVVFTPKSLLRARSARSSIDELTQGSFLEAIDDASVTDPSSVRRVVLATGKVTHEAIAARDTRGAAAAVVRIEQLYPWPFDAVAAALDRYPNAREIVWLQEEPENMGPWNFVKGRLYEAHGDTHAIRRVSRDESGSPATGSAAIHAQEQEELLERAFADV